MLSVRSTTTTTPTENMAPLKLDVLATNANLDDISIVNLVGPMLLGFLWGYCLYGILIVQLYVYSVQFGNKDPLSIKSFVWLVFFCETLFTFMCTVSAWKMFAAGWGNEDALLNLDWGFKFLPPLNGLIAFLAQSFYVRRIWKLTKNLPVCVFIECVALMQVTASFYYGIKVDIAERFDLVFQQNTPICIWVVGSAACDVLITIALVTILRRAHTNAHFIQTSNVVTKLIRYTIETGLVTSVMAIVELILWLALSKWNFHYTFFLMIGRIYSNALMATINSRAALMDEKKGGGQRTSLQFIKTTGHMQQNALWNDLKSSPASPGGSVRSSIRSSMTPITPLTPTTPKLINQDINHSIRPPSKLLVQV